MNFSDITAYVLGNPTWQSGGGGAEKGIHDQPGPVSPECGVSLAPQARLFREVVKKTLEETMSMKLCFPAKLAGGDARAMWLYVQDRAQVEQCSLSHYVRN